MTLIKIEEAWKEKAKEFKKITTELFILEKDREPTEMELNSRMAQLKVKAGLYVELYFMIPKEKQTYCKPENDKEMVSTKVPNCLLSLATEKEFDNFLEKCRAELEIRKKEIKNKTVTEL